MWRDEALALDMLIAARKALAFCAGATLDRFLADDMLQQATIHAIQTVGEAARLVSDDYKRSHPEFPWPEIIGMRHRLVHEYFRVVPEKVFAVVRDDLPALVEGLEKIVPPAGDEMA